MNLRIYKVLKILLDRDTIFKSFKAFQIVQIVLIIQQLNILIIQK